ncbi:MAG: SpvB/TcaC N-terminal domain-containing protein, partial [Bacillota bacterium]
MAKSGTDPAAVSLPAGTGFAAGLGEAFSLDLNTGQGNYSVPIPLPDGVAGFAPRLKLEYASAYGHGPFGLGWRLPLRELTRRLDPGVPAAEGPPSVGGLPRVERFLDGPTELFPMPDGTWRPRLESTFQLYRREGDGWSITERNGIRHELGLSPGARVADPDRPDRVQAWLLERSLDTSGNEIRYRYVHDGGSAYLEEVRYALYAVRLVYSPRPDARLNG